MTKQQRYKQSPKGIAQAERYKKSPGAQASREKFKKSARGILYAHEEPWKRYGIDMTYPRYLEMLEACGDKCVFCTVEENEVRKVKGKRLRVDHDHATGEIRGLLCNRHNLLLGHFDKIIPELLQYLKVDSHWPTVGDPNGQVW